MKVKVQCAWCQRYMGTKECNNLDRNLPRVTHSICPACYQGILAENHLKGERPTASRQPTGSWVVVH